jgi:predicted NACHT family NTPase
MSDLVYQWKRFWCLREGKVSLSDGGYLYDPYSEMGKLYNAGLLSFSEIFMTPCLILLGEPGTGKTTTIRMEWDHIKQMVEKQGDQVIWLDLRSYASEDRLIADLFQGPVFTAWTKGRHMLHLFLDSLDECLLRIDNLASILIDWLGKCPVKRLFLRIICRTAEWPVFLEKNLRRVWPDDAIIVYELAPLRRVDVIETARANNLSSEAFLQEIDQKGVVPLAIKPITLRFLLNTYRKNGKLSSTQLELYLQGCRLLCEETSESRIAAGRRGNLTADQKMIVASRIAAVSIFSNKYAIWIGINQGDIPDADIDVRDLSGGFEEATGQRITIDEQTLRETLNTGLFSSRGTNRIGWAHQTYAEFLAARYLAQSKMKPTQIVSLIVHPADPEKRLVPQLHGVAIWLSAMNPEVLLQILATDPEVLLKSDVITESFEHRASLVRSLLKLADEERILHLELDVLQHLERLSYPDLPNDLRPYILDRGKVAGARSIAIEIARACRLDALEESLADVAIDTSESLEMRTRAGYVVATFGSEKTKKKMKMLACNDQLDDELRACGFMAVWPNHMSAEELFSLLTPPKKENFVGLYQRFLFHNLVENIQPGDLPLALNWVENQEEKKDSSFVIERVGDLILSRALNYFGSPGVVQAFAKTAYRRLGDFKPIFNIDSSDRSILGEDDGKRHGILTAMIPLIEDPEKNSVKLLFSNTPMVLSKDLSWMLGQLCESSKESQPVWVQLIRSVFNWRDQTHIEIMFEAYEKIPIMKEVFSWLFKPVILGSEEAQKMKEAYIRDKRLLDRIKDRPPLKPPPAERIATFLSLCESGELDGWWHLNLEMTLEPTSVHYGDELESDLTVLPGWRDADETTRRRIVEAAKRYLLASDPQDKTWLGTNKLYRPAFAGFRSLRLLYQMDHDFLITLPSGAWKKWAPIILAYPTSSGSNGEEIQSKLVSMAYRHAPEVIIETLMILIDKENETSGHLFIIDKIEDCWDERLAGAMLSKLKDEKLKPDSMGGLLHVLLKHRVGDVRAFAESLVPLPVPTGEIERSKATIAARMLMSHVGRDSWPLIWSAIQQDVNFGREVIQAIATSDRHHEGIEAQFSEGQLAELFIWLAHQYPYDEDPEHDGVYMVSPRDAVADFRDSILNHLQQLGTVRACEAIQRIAVALPDLGFLKQVLLDARKMARLKTWIPPRPVDILRIVSNQQLRLVQNGEDLLDVIVESLKRLEVKLQGETPAAIDLWNEVSKGKFRPKDEGRLSDYMKRHLEEDLKNKGIVVNREVEIRRGEGSGSGEITDIHVNAVVQDNGQISDPISAIIEVKGCWNEKLEQGMKEQLVDRYLKDNRCQHGLYLIGWFNCAQWDDKDYRKSRAPKLTISQAQEQYEAKASELSRGGRCVKALVINTALR